MIIEMAFHKIYFDGYQLERLEPESAALMILTHLSTGTNHRSVFHCGL